MHSQHESPSSTSRSDAISSDGHPSSTTSKSDTAVVPEWTDADWEDFIGASDESEHLEPETEEACKLRRKAETPPEVLRLEFASEMGDLDSVKAVFQEWKNDNNPGKARLHRFASSFSFAIDGDQLAIAECMIDHGVEFNEAHFQYAIDKNAYAFLYLFLERGYDINMTWTDWAPGPLAYKFDNEQMTRWLLNHDANPNTETRIGITPISIAVISAPLSIIELLIESGGAASLKHGRLVDNAIYRSCPDYLEILEYLLRIGCQSDINELEYEDNPDLQRQQNWVIGCRNPLHHAVMEGRLDVVKLLVGWGANPDVRDGKGRHPITLARVSNHDEVVNYLQNLSHCQNPHDGVEFSSDRR
ncbi:MAG: hypothetical protein Q9195_006343 [Heterodermia aff. obscurata]